MSKTDVLVIINLLIIFGSFFAVWLLTSLYAMVVKSIAWVCDANIQVEDTAVPLWIHNTFFGSRCKDFYWETLTISFYTFFATVTTVLFYHFVVWRIAVASAVLIFAGMHTLRWAVRTKKSIDRLKEIVGEHSSEKGGKI